MFVYLAPALSSMLSSSREDGAWYEGLVTLNDGVLWTFSLVLTVVSFPFLKDNSVYLLDLQWCLIPGKTCAVCACSGLVCRADCQCELRLQIFLKPLIQTGSDPGEVRWPSWPEHRGWQRSCQPSIRRQRTRSVHLEGKTCEIPAFPILSFCTC